jgi:plastocyanin
VLRRVPALVSLALLAAACGQEQIVVRPAEPPEPAFFTQVVDFEQDVGPGLAMATDADGNPHMTYLALPEETEGETPAPVVPGAPVLPAIKHAHLVEDAWTRTSVAEDLADLTPEDESAIWVDQEGIHHVAWTEAGDLFYTDNPEGGAEAKPQQVVSGPVEGISISAGENGTPWISFYVLEGGALNPRVFATTLSGAKWSVEPIAGASPETPATTAIRVAGDEPIVAYGDGSATMLASRTGGEWATETADQAGGLGVAMALDADGSPHLAYYDESGAVKTARSTGGGWEVEEVADAGSPPDLGSAAIVVDSEGTEHVGWQTEDGTIGYSNNQEGDFGEPEEVPRSEAGARPVLGVNAEDEVWLGWVDTEDTEVQLAIRAESEPLLALPSPQPTGGAVGTEPAAQCEPDGTDLAITAPVGAVNDGFDTDCLAVPAGEQFTVELTNDDTVPHNWELFTDSSATEQLGGGTVSEPVAGGASETYDVDAIDDRGNFFFRCGFHPATMTGTLVVAKAKE